jgi:hypothetical protein
MCTSKASKLSTGGKTEVAGGKQIDAHVALYISLYMCTSKASKLSTSGETEVAGGKQIDAHVAHKLPRSPHVTAACSVSICTLVPVKQGKKILFFQASSQPARHCRLQRECSYSCTSKARKKNGRSPSLSLPLCLSNIIYIYSKKKRRSLARGLAD